jgi:hypothetical protein
MQVHMCPLKQQIKNSGHVNIFDNILTLFYVNTSDYVLLLFYCTYMEEISTTFKKICCCKFHITY